MLVTLTTYNTHFIYNQIVLTIGRRKRSQPNDVADNTFWFFTEPDLGRVIPCNQLFLI